MHEIKPVMLDFSSNRLTILSYSWYIVRSHDWGFDRTRNREWFRSRGCGRGYIRSCFLDRSLRIISSSLAVRRIRDLMFALLGELASFIPWFPNRSLQASLTCFIAILQIDVIASLLSGRLVRERIGPAMLSAVQSQVMVLLCMLEKLWFHQMAICL